jgi:hypothetical protein
LVLGFLFAGNKRGPFVATFFTAEEINPFVTVEKLKLPAAPLKRDLRFAPTSLQGIFEM